MTTDDVRSETGPVLEQPDGWPEGELSQEEQAQLLTEPSFENRIDDEAELLAAEFGPPDENGGYGRGDIESAETYSGGDGS
ncbi:hypothetical protein [Kribbella shirazensis]|uniref:DUF5709 domain-containing protein n=1 Tax=Kribbella shirazensis TaxID=1105143 RepID=A0A7X5VC00_9ACTN|nr:hypothetical protein [Kribbella shirazensis]NIK58006.1 hypothetical protein [Kribbella shirazensis]